MVTGVGSHASMSEASRLESCEKEITHLRTLVKDLLQVVKENRQDIGSHEDQLQELSNSLGSVENAVSSLNERISGESESSEAGAAGEAT